ncbi:LuxR C-terminal-related transcriptional regulator [Streptomyces sp. JL4002]|uniref:LuxR C-terminal-related transcriptional regulator n=1 Tax=Streptomyces sp. JL4002 TaxID=3404781 RepID=UPI003B28C45A
MGPHARSLPEVRGREQQLARIGASLQDVTGIRQSQVLLVGAGPGAGKTRLLVEAVNAASRNGFAVVHGAAAGSGAAPGTASAGTRPRASDTAEQAFPHPNACSVIEAAQTWLRNDLEDVRTLVTLDDLHLVPPSSLKALGDLVVACRNRPILWLLAFTSERSSTPPEPLRSHFARLRSRLPVEPVPELAPLRGEALARLVADYAGAAPAPALLALAECLNGVPRAVIELVRGLAEDDDIDIVDGIAHLRPTVPQESSTEDSMGVPPLVPKRFSALVREDLSSLAEPTMTALRLAAVLGSPFAPDDLSAMLGEAPVGLLAVVDEAVTRGLLVCGEHDFSFRDEPVWRVLLDSVPPPVRAALRRQAAEMLLSRPDGIERAALQLVHIAQPGNVEALRIISEGSQRLLAVDPSTAATLAIRCMALVSPGQAERLRFAKTAVGALTRAGDLDRAIALAKDTIEESIGFAAARPPAAFAQGIAALQASMAAALLLRGDTRSARRSARDALAGQEAGTQQHEAVITHLAASYLTGDSTAVERAQKIMRSPDRHAQSVRVAAMTHHALGQWRDGQVGDSVRTLREAVALDRRGEEVQLLDPRWFLAFALTRTDEYEEADAVIQCSVRTGVSEARTLAGATPALLRAPLLLARGRLEEAEAAARDAVGTDGPCLPMLAPQAWLVLGAVALRRGALGQAAVHVKTLEQEFPQQDSNPWQGAHLLLSAQLAEAQADMAAVADLLSGVAARADTLRALLLADPATAAWCVRASLAADLPDVARTVAASAECLRVLNPRVPAVLAAATHARALVDKDADALAGAGQLHRNPWARAAAAEDLGVLLLDRGDQEAAIAELDRSMGEYGVLGGEHDAARVRARLRQLGVRRRHWTHTKRPASGWESLTKTERKVAELVADGLTNQQAARHLFISPHTVGFHLRQVYRKLDIRSRTALIRIRA